jgi:hypothetical protein
MSNREKVHLFGNLGRDSLIKRGAYLADAPLLPPLQCCRASERPGSQPACLPNMSIREKVHLFSILGRDSPIKRGAYLAAAPLLPPLQCCSASGRPGSQPACLPNMSIREKVRLFSILGRDSPIKRGAYLADAPLLPPLQCCSASGRPGSQPACLPNMSIREKVHLFRILGRDSLIKRCAHLADAPLLPPLQCCRASGRPGSQPACLPNMSIREKVHLFSILGRDSPIKRGAYLADAPLLPPLQCCSASGRPGSQPACLPNMSIREKVHLFSILGRDSPIKRGAYLADAPLLPPLQFYRASGRPGSQPACLPNMSIREKVRLFSIWGRDSPIKRGAYLVVIEAVHFESSQRFALAAKSVLAQS